MPRFVVLDTSVLLHDPRAPLSFPGSTVVIPAAVVEELDAKKHNPGELGAKARAAARLLDELRMTGPLAEGVPAPGASTIRVELNHRAAADLHRYFQEDTADNRILAVASNLQRAEGTDVTVVSRDVILRIKGDALGLAVSDYAEVLAQPLTASSHHRLVLGREQLDQLCQAGRLAYSGLPLGVNQFALVQDEAGAGEALARCVAPDLLQLTPAKGAVWGVTPRNLQQQMAVDLLRDDQVQLVTLAGPAGTGKTLLALAAGLQQVEDERTYRRLVVSRPVVPMGRDLGYLPGSQDEKLRPWMQPIYDNLEHLFGLADRDGPALAGIMAGMKEIVVEALTYIRGRSLPQQYLIVDEAQNLTRHEVKTVITRAGEGTKVVLVGDPDQIDHPYLDRQSNGLVYAMERFRDQPIAGHVTLVKGERSPLAQLAAQLL